MMRLQKCVLHESVDSSMGFAIIGTMDKFTRNKHVRKCWRFCLEHRIPAYLILYMNSKSPTKQRSKVKLPSRVYPSLDAVIAGSSGASDVRARKIDVVVPCLMPRHIPNIVEESVRVGAHTIWFQENNWTPEFQEQAEAKGLNVVRGCMLKHRQFKGVGKFLHPCYWHGLGSAKVSPRTFV